MIRFAILTIAVLSTVACAAASPDLKSRKFEVRTADGKIRIMHYGKPRAIAAGDLAVNLSEIPGSRLSEAQEQSLRRNGGTGWVQKVGLLPGKQAWAWAHGWNQPYLFDPVYAKSVGKKDVLERSLRKSNPLRFLGPLYRFRASVPIEREGRTGWVHTFSSSRDYCVAGEVLFLSNRKLARNGRVPAYDTRIFILDCAGKWKAAEIKRFLENARRVPKRTERPSGS